MPRCHACAAEIPDGALACPSCGPALEPTGPFLPRPAQERFPPGTILAGRYRVVARLGGGGMGEVFRADDLTLGESVALKFLSPAFSSDPDRLARFRKEASLARQVTHPNACRVHDVAEHQGQPFLTMEFIDGENLASLLRRVGRLPEDRAVLAGRQLCSALQAVHDAGLLHRDLKPANVMLDGRGKVRLTDFGLTAVAGEVQDVRSGTPRYLSPEQLAGAGVSVRSDLFALGLVLYELVTGRFPSEAAAGPDVAPKRPSELVPGIAPAVEQVILRCLEHSPDARPRSAREVMAALPGADEVAEALAAGKTPSPQAVAEVGGEGRLSRRAALSLLAGLLLTLAIGAPMASRYSLCNLLPRPEPPAVLMRQAEKILLDLGHDQTPRDRVGYFAQDRRYLNKARERAHSRADWDVVRSGQPPGRLFLYRQGPFPQVPTRVGGDLPGLPTPLEPLTLSGSVEMTLDHAGRLRGLLIVPPQLDPEGAALPGPRWEPLFEAAGLDVTRFEAAPPRWNPLISCDARAAWTGAWPDNPREPIRLEAGAHRGKVVYFQIIPEGSTPPREVPSDEDMPTGALLLIQVPIALVWLASLLLAGRNLWLGRADLAGASRLAGLFAALGVLAWLGGHHPLLSGHGRFFPLDELLSFQSSIGYVAFYAIQVFLCYLALEPAVRRRWPARLTAWGRALRGRLTDPMVGRDGLIGCVAGAVLWFAPLLIALVGDWLGLQTPPSAGPFGIIGVVGPPQPLSVMLSLPAWAISGAIIQTFIAFVLYLVLRKPWLVWPAHAIQNALFLIPAFWVDELSLQPAMLVPLLWGAVIAALIAWRGVLATVFCLGSGYLLTESPLTLDLSCWYAWQGLAAVAALVVVAIAACRIATRGERLLAAGWFGDEESRHARLHP